MNRIRYTVQTVLVLLMGYIGWRHQIIGGGPQGTPPIDAYCPLGAIEALPTLISNGQFIDKIAPSNLMILASLLLAIVITGAVFCGWLCPLGAIGDWLYALRKKVFPYKWELSPAVAWVFSYGRFVLLIAILYFSWAQSKLWFETYDPFKQIFHMNVESATSAAAISLFLLLSMAIERFWCRFLCPLGAVIGLFSRFSLLVIKREPARCIRCGKCDKNCPAGISPASNQTVNDSRCLSCYQCVASCPVESALAVKSRFSCFNYQFKPLSAALVGILLFVGTLTVINATGNFSAYSPNAKPVAQITATTEIKGWMKWNEVIDKFQVDEQQLMEELKLPASFDRNRSLKSLGQEFGFEAETVRDLIDKSKK